MNQVGKISTLVTGLLLFMAPVFANKETLKQGWDAFNANKRKEAKQFFQTAAGSADTKAEAHLALALAYWGDDKRVEGFKAFQEFFKAAENPYPALYALWTSPIVFEGYGKKNEEQLKFLKTLCNDPKANGTIKAMAHGMLGKHYIASGNFQDAEKEYKQQGSVETWQILGTFDNTSGSGYNKDFGALSKPQANAVFKNKVDADVKWFTPPYFRHDRWYDFGNYFSISNSVMYAQTFLKSDEDQEVFLRSGNSGSLKIWVNDKLVTEVMEERNCDMDIYANNIKLVKGYNRILVQIGESETDNANFMIRITDKDGNPVKGITVETVYHSYPKSAEYSVSSVPFFAEDYFENKLKTNPDNLLNLIVLSEIYMRNDKVYEARKVLKKAKSLAPDNSFLGTRIIEAYARDKNVTDLTKEYEKIKSNDPDCVYAIKNLIDEATEKENYDEKEKLLDKYISIYGKDEYSDITELNIAINRKKQDKIISLCKSLYEKYPNNYDLMAFNYQLELSGGKDLAKGNVILKNYLKNNYADKVVVTLASNYFKLGSVNDGFKLFKERIKNFPYLDTYYDDLADIYFDAQQYENALTYAQQQLDLAPYIGGYWFKLGKIKQAMNDDEAKDFFKKAIYYSPTYYEARKQLRKMEKKKDLFENFEKTDAYEIFKKAPKAEDFPDDNSIILLNEAQRVVYPEGATEERVEIVVKVFNQTGIDIWKEYSIGYNRYRQKLIIDKAEVLKKDGNKVQAEKNDSYLVFTNLEADDAIHISYRIENYNTGKLAQHFWEEFNFNFDYPVHISRYSLLVPASKEFKHQVLGADIKPSTKDVENMKLLAWEYKDQPAVKPEPYMPPLSDIGAVLFISTLPDWKFVSNWYSDLSTSLAKTDFEIKETIAELFKEKKNLSELEKAKTIYNYIEANVSYSNVPFMHGPIIPQRSSRTLNTKLGDCKDVSTLFVAMCKEAGLKANLILVDTKDNGEKHLALPTIDFNHCIAQLQAGGKPYYVELTDQKLSFSSLPDGDINANILFIPRDGDSPAEQLTKLDSKNRPLNSTIRETDLKFENNDITFIRKNVKSGVFASSMRSDYADKGRDKQEKAMTQAIAGDFTNPAKLLSLTFNDLKTLDDTVSYSYSFNIKNEVTEMMGLKIFRIPWSDGIRSLDFLSLETRKYPFLVSEFTSAEILRETMNIEIPKGKVLAEQPKSVKLTCPAADYSLTYTITTPGKIKAVREMKYKKDSVSPEEYTQFREFFNKVAETDMKQLGFKSL